MTDKITCPNCGNHFDVEAALSGELKARFQKEYEKKVAEQAEHFNHERQKLEEERERFKAVKARENELFKEKLNEKLGEKLKEERLRIQKTTTESFEQELKALQEENERRKSENKEMKEREVLLMRKEAALKEQQEEIKLQAEKEVLSRQSEIEEKARLKERENFELEKIKLLKQIEDNKKLAEEMKRKAEQGSMQLQGEVQELALEDLLSRAYPFDTIEEVPKGVRGADVIQTVLNSAQISCGKIVYESKRTKNFGGDWIEKLKQDQIVCKADIAVIVTETMPTDMERFGEKNGVWVCGFHEAKSLSFVLREMLIRTQATMVAQDNKGDKMELLYNYLTSAEFVQNIKRIVENYDNMILQLNSEKKAMHRIWATREKHIWSVQENISALFGSIKGIAGNALAASDILELPDRDIEG